MKEIRSLESAEFRIEPNSRKIEGYALLFNTESQDLGGFREVIKPQAMNGVLEKSDILALYNHDEKDVLARSTHGQGTLTLNVDEKGLKYTFEAPKTPLGDEVLDAILRGDLRNSSFAFTISEKGQEWEKRDKEYIRNIIQFEELFDVSPVYRPAYLDTTVAARSLDQNIITENRDLKIEVTVEVKEGEDLTDETPDEMPDEIQEENNITEPTLERIDSGSTEGSEDPDQETNSEMIDVVYDNETYSVPYDILRDYISNRKFENYINNLEDMIKNLKK